MLGDIFYGMLHRPVLSQTVSILNDLQNTSWADYLERVEQRYFPDIQMKQSIDFDRLSKKDIHILEKSVKNLKIKMNMS